MDNKLANVIVPSIPVVVKKGNISIVKSLHSSELFKKCLKIGAVCKEEVVYKSTKDDFLRGEYPNLTLLSRLNIVTNCRTTVARFMKNETTVERTSSEIIKLIGQKNYDTVFSALCSVISQELRIRAILALLTEDSKVENNPTSNSKEFTRTQKTYADKECQTYETSKSLIEKYSQRKVKRLKKLQPRPYIVPRSEEKVLNRIVIDPKTALEATEPTKTHSNETSNTDLEKRESNQSLNDTDTFPELKGIINEDSNFTDTSIDNISLTSQHSLNWRHLLENPNQIRTKQILDNIGQHTAANTVPLELLDGSVVMVCTKPADIFHWATPEILMNLTTQEYNKLMYHQALIDWKHCMEADEDGNLPIHQAVLANDLDFLRRQCVVLMKKHGCIDVTADGNVTALQMSLYKDGERCAAALLHHGADPLLQDDEGKSFIHTAAEVSPEHLRVALKHCRSRARDILREDEDLWNPNMENQTDEQLARFLLNYICLMCDNQGYTPLMLASKQGNHSSTEQLVEASPDTINRPMPNSGNTALYLAVSTACSETLNSSNHTKISDNFLKTIEILVEAGADPSCENHSGSSVNTLLTEFNIVELSVLIANKMTSIKYFDGKIFAPHNINSYMLIKDTDGKVDIAKIKNTKTNSANKEVYKEGAKEAFKDIADVDNKAKTNQNPVKIVSNEVSVDSKKDAPNFIRILPKLHSQVNNTKAKTVKDTSKGKTVKDKNNDETPSTSVKTQKKERNAKIRNCDKLNSSSCNTNVNRKSTVEVYETDGIDKGYKEVATKANVSNIDATKGATITSNTNDVKLDSSDANTKVSCNTAKLKSTIATSNANTTTILRRTIVKPRILSRSQNNSNTHKFVRILPKPGPQELKITEEKINKAGSIEAKKNKKSEDLEVTIKRSKKELTKKVKDKKDIDNRDTISDERLTYTLMVVDNED